MSAESDIEISTRVENISNKLSPSVAGSAADSATAIATAAAAVVADKMDKTDSATNASKQMANGENNGNAPAQVQVQQQQQQQSAEQPQTQSMQEQAMQPIQPELQLQQPPKLQTAANEGKMDADASLTNFKVLYVVAQLCGLTLIVLVGSWIGVHLGGLGGTANPKIEFNWHPLLMTIGLVFLYGNSILVYRGFRNTSKKTLKLAHASVHMGAFILTVIALKTVFDSHNLASPPIPNMYSLHSWLGLSAVLIFCMQYVAGFMAYLVPGLRESYKAAYMPLHIYFGLFGFVLAIASALMGITEKAMFSLGANYSALPSSAVIANMCGVMFVIFGGLVVYLTTEGSYKRKPRPEDAVLLTGVNE